MKTKDQAMQKVKNYLTHLQMHGRMPKVIHIDCRHEFINDTLLKWLYLKGMEVYMTAPYSLSQNRVAECINWTLENFARAMCFTTNLAVFL
jgi:hypothetical protein